MTAILAQNLAPIMFAALVAILLLGYPVAFSLGAAGLMFFVVGVELAPYSDGAITLSWSLLGSLPGRIFDVMRNETLLAIPFFTFMGLILERSGMAEDLLDTVGQLFGTLRGGLAYAVVFVGALLAATTGVVAASVISMGLISLPIMLRYGYDRRLASGVIAASGTLAQIIPPSLVLIVLADQLGRSVDDMYKGALLPGLMLAGLYALFVFLTSLVKPDAAPGLPESELQHRNPDGSRGLLSLAVLAALSALFGAWMMRGAAYPAMDLAILGMAWAIAFALAAALVNGAIERVTGLGLLSPLALRATFVMVPPLLLIFLVLGTILVGVATPTEGGAMGAVGAMALAFGRRIASGDERRFSLAIVRSAAEATAKLAAFVMFILIGARIFSLTFYGVNGHLWVEHLLVSLPGGMYGFLIAVTVLVFLLAFFLDFFELAFILVPLLKPAAETIFRNAPEAVAIAKAAGLATITVTDSSGSDARDRRRRDAVRHLVRRSARGQHADELHASPLRICALLSALSCTARCLSGPGHRTHDGTGDDRRDLLGCGAVRRHPARDGGDRPPRPVARHAGEDEATPGPPRRGEDFVAVPERRPRRSLRAPADPARHRGRARAGN